MFKTPARYTFTYPDVPYLFDNFTPSSACTPVKRAIAARNKHNEIAARHAERAAKHASGPTDKPPRPSPNIPEQGEAEAEAEAEHPEHGTEKPYVHAPSHPTRTPRGAGRSRPSYRGRQSHHPPPYGTNIHGERQRNWYVQILAKVRVLTPKTQA